MKCFRNVQKKTSQIFRPRCHTDRLLRAVVYPGYSGVTAKQWIGSTKYPDGYQRNLKQVLMVLWSGSSLLPNSCKHSNNAGHSPAVESPCAQLLPVSF